MTELKQFNAKTVLPKDDAILYDKIIGQNGIFEGCVLSHVINNQVSITAGTGIIKGRKFNQTAETIACAQASSGTLPGRIYLRMDLGNISTPIEILTVCSATLPALVQNENCNNDNGVYEIELATYTAGTTSISSLVITAKTVKTVNKIILNTQAEVLANTEEDRVVDALVVKEIINSLSGCWISFTDVTGTPTTEPYIHWLTEE